MVEEYIRKQHEWLGRLYPAPDSRFETAPLQPTVDPQSPQAHIIQTFQDLLEAKCRAQEAAERLASAILSSADILTTYNNMWGCFFQAVEHFSSIETLYTSSNLLARLASLPDAINARQEAIVLEGFPEDLIIQPGEPILFDRLRVHERLWQDLPYFAINLTESMQGPEAYLSRGESPAVAERKGTNINTFLAILVRDHGADFPDLFGVRVQYAFWTLSSALEHPPKARLGKNIALHVPAACRWITLAEDTVWEALDAGFEGEPWTAMAGRLWQSQVGRNQVDGRRWAFWKQRLETLRDDPQLDLEAADIALQAARLM